MPKPNMDLMNAWLEQRAANIPTHVTEYELKYLATRDAIELLHAARNQLREEPLTTERMVGEQALTHAIMLLQWDE